MKASTTVGYNPAYPWLEGYVCRSPPKSLKIERDIRAPHAFLCSPVPVCVAQGFGGRPWYRQHCCSSTKNGHKNLSERQSADGANGGGRRGAVLDQKHGPGADAREDQTRTTDSCSRNGKRFQQVSFYSPRFNLNVKIWRAAFA